MSEGKKTNNAADAALCPVRKKCGGCQLQNLSYTRQLSFKQVRCIKLLGRFCHVEEIIGMAHPFHYRNKVQAAFGRTRGGKVISGVYQSGTHNIVCVDDCMIEDRTADSIIVTVRKLIISFGISPYDDRTGRGFLRHVLVRRGFSTGQVMVVLVTGGIAFPHKNAFLKELLKRHGEITTVVQNVNDSHTSLVLGEREEVLYGGGYIEDTLLGKTFIISPKSFYQINPVQTEILYGKAIEYAALTGSETVLDTYCGIGTIGIIAADGAKNVVSCEINPAAVADAKKNARRNDVKNIRFFKADAGEFMTGCAEEGENIDVVFMDPPRAGASKEFLKSLCALAPKTVVYISCNPETLARDLFYLTKNGYKVKKIQPVDMFPWTEHVESVVLMSRARVGTTV